MRIHWTWRVAGLTAMIIVASAAERAAAFSFRPAPFGSAMARFGGAPHGSPEFPGVHLRQGERDLAFDRFRRAGRTFDGHFYGGGLFASDFGDVVGPYQDQTPYGASYSISVAPAGVTVASAESRADCALYRVIYDKKGQYQGVTVFHPCR